MKNKVFILSIIFLLIAVTGFFSFIIYNKDALGTETLNAELQKIAESNGHMSFSAESITGNPLTGFTLNDVELAAEGEKTIISSTTMKLVFEKLPLLKGKVKLKDISFTDAFFDTNTAFSVISSPLSMDKSASEMLPDSINLENCTFSTGSSPLKINDLAIEIPGPGIYEGKGNGTYNGLDFDLQLKGADTDSGFKMETLELSQKDTTFQLTGTVGKEIDLTGNFSTPDLSFISTLIPNTAKANMSGGISTDLQINGPFSAPHISGTMEANNFSVARFHFNQGNSLWQYKNRTLFFSEITAEVFGSPVKGELDITFTDGPLDSRLKLQGENLDVEDWYTPLSWLTFASGKVDRAEVDLQGPFRQLTGKVTLTTSSGATIADHPFSELSTDLEIKNGVDISIDGKGTWHKAHIKAKGAIKIGKPRSSMNITFTTRDLDIHQLSESYPVVDQIGLQGKLAGKAVLKGKTNELALSGSFGSDKARLRENLVTDLQFSFRHLGKTTDVSDLKMKWKGNSLSGKGTVNDLTGSSPSGTVSFTCPSIKIFKTLNLKNIKSSGSFEKNTLAIQSFTSGLAGGKLDLKGQVSFHSGQEPSLDLQGSSRGMKASQLASQLGVPLSIKGNIDSQFSVVGTPSDPEVGTELTSAELDIRGFALKKAKASIKARDEKLFIKGLKGDLSGSPLRCSGTINLEKGDKDTLDVRTTVESLDLFSFTGKAFPDLPISGVVSTDISITGPLKSPEMVINAGAETFNIAGLSFNDLKLEMIPGETEKDPLQYLLSAYLGTSPLELTGTARLEGKGGPEITFQSSGKGLEADSLTEKVNGTLKHTFKGNFDLTCSGKIDKNGIRGKGQLDSGSMVIQGYTMEKVKIPFSFEGDTLLAKQGSGSIYGGKASMEGELNLKDAKWHMNFSLVDSDLARFSREFRQFDLESTGKADLKLDLKGVLGKIYLMSGTGSLELREGTVGGFQALKSLAKDGILTYRTLNTCFNLDGGNIYLLPGSRVSAYPDDKVYKYLSFSGALGGPQTKMDLICSGQINTQALSALQGVIQGIVRSGNEGDSNLLLEDFISGLVGGYSGPDFRLISFELAGTWSKPGLYSLEVDSPLKTVSNIPSDNTQGDPYQKEIKFEVSIPTGEGTDNSTSAGDQFKKQVMENLLKQIFIDEDDINNGNGTGN